MIHEVGGRKASEIDDAIFVGTKIFVYIFTQRVNLEIHRPRY